jgi:hypothetical protein
MMLPGTKVRESHSIYLLQVIGLVVSVESKIAVENQTGRVAPAY